MKKRVWQLLLLLGLIVFVGIGIFLYKQKDNLFNFNSKETVGTQSSGAEEEPHIDFYDSFIQTLNATSSEHKRAIIGKYCTAVLDGEIEKFSFEGIIYDPTQSLFLYNLCNYPKRDEQGGSTQEGYWEGKFSNISGLVQTNFTQLRDDEICPGLGGVCSSSCDIDDDENMNGCDIGNMGIVIFNDIINDYFNMKLMSLYGNNGESSKDLSIEAFSEKYFGKCGSKQYITNETITGEEAYCSHPKTYEILKAYIENINNLKESLIYLDYEQIAKGDSMISQGLKTTNAEDDEDKITDENYVLFKNLLNNELMWYDLYLTYYLFNISDSTKFQEFEVGTVDSILEKQESQIQGIIIEINKAKKAVDLSEKILKNTYSTFPMHIALMAYYEDILNFKKQFVKIYTPIHQLYYKLRNVQKDDS